MLRKPRILLTLPLLSLLAACGVFGGGDGGPKTPSLGNRTPILSRVTQVVEADESLANTPVVLPAQAPTAEWPQPGGNAAKAPGHAALSAAPAQVWSVQVAGSTSRRRLALASTGPLPGITAAARDPGRGAAATRRIRPPTDGWRQSQRSTRARGRPCRCRSA